MKTVKRTIILGLMLVIALTMLAQADSRLTFRRYTTQDGLPQLQTERLFQDSRGYIYVGTLSGFVRFDGKTFTPFLKGRRFNIVDFAEVAGTTRAFDFRRQWLTDFDDVTMRPLTTEGRWLLNNFNSGSLPNGYILLEDEREQNRRLCRVTAERMDTLMADMLMDQMPPDRRLFLDSATVYVPTADGLFRLSEGGAERLSEKADFFSLLRTEKGLLAFAGDGIYVVKEEFGRGKDDVTGEKDEVGREKDEVLQRVTAFDFPSVNYGLIVRPLANGHLVIADEHSLYEYDGSAVRQVATGFNLVKDLLVDCWNRLWVATYEGLYCYFNRCFTVHRLSDADDIVRAIATDGQGRLVAGTLNGKLLTIEHSSFKFIEDEPDNYYAPSAVTIGGSVYMAGNGDVMCYADGTKQWLSLPHDRYRFVARAGDRLIIGGRNTVTAYDPTDGRLDTLATDVSYPWCAAEDNGGHLWVGTTFGLFCDGDKYNYQNAGTDGIRQEGQPLIVTTMERDSMGTIFFASKDSLFLIRNGRVEPLPMAGLSGHEVRSLHVSKHGYLVVAVIDGLFVSRIGEDYTLEKTRFFDHLNGFTMLEPLQATMGETPDGTVWVAGVEEMTSFRPEELLAYDDEDTYIDPPLRWWQHWWVWLAALVLLSVVVWAVTRWYEKRRQRRRMIRLQHEKQQREELIRDIRQKAIEEMRTSTDAPAGGEANAAVLAQDIMKMTEPRNDERLTFRTASGTIVVDTADIAYFKGEGNYSQIVTFHGDDIVLVGLGALEKMVSPAVFVRADRSTLVNIHNVCQLLPKQRRCLFRSSDGHTVETTLLAPAFKRLQVLL